MQYWRLPFVFKRQGLRCFRSIYVGKPILNGRRPKTDRLARQMGAMVETPPFIKNPEAIRSYSHFDRRTSFAAKVEKVTDPAFVRGYGFYPLIEKEMRRIKPKDDGTRCNKPRPIRYAAHLDRCIFQYYTGLLNEQYNALAVGIGINNSAIAYRTNLKGRSNCQFAYQAFSIMRSMGSCYVYAGDFEDFFETLGHAYLKERVRELLNDSHIPDDYFHVLRNAMRYSTWHIHKLLDFHGLPHTKSGIKRLNRLERVLNPSEFRAMVKTSVESPWKSNGGKGIPQGLPISGVLANIYMIKFDEMLVDVAHEIGGIYMRYSDDFILIAPTEDGFKAGMSEFNRAVKNVPFLSLSVRKTHSYKLDNEEIYQIKNEEISKKPGGHIDYLGFSFDGSTIRMRQRTVGRYYRRTYKRVSNLFNEKRHPGKRRVCALYLDCSSRGSDPNKNRNVRKLVGRSGCHGNFHAYVQRAQAVFSNDPIALDFKNHKRKIRKRSRKIMDKREGTLSN